MKKKQMASEEQISPPSNFSLQKVMIHLKHFYQRHAVLIFFVVLLALHIFLRFYQLFERANFDWDQVDSAWAAKSILVDKQFILNGPVAKGNSGIHMGPLYFYAIAIFYFFTNLDPVASPIFQAVLSITNFLALFFITKKLFGTKVACIAGIINIFSLTVMNADRVQSAYYLIVPISYAIFYTLYKSINGNFWSLPWLGFFTGFAFHIDFTSIFYPILIFVSLPFFYPHIKNKKFYVYLISAVAVFLTMIAPTVFAEFNTRTSSSNGIVQLLHTSYHGFHLRRFLQISHDGFISFEQILQFKIFRPFVFIVLPVFFVLYYFTNKSKKQNLILFYLMSMWVLIPWIILSTYSGELTDYYFSLPRDIAIATLAYITLFLIQRKLLIYKLIPGVFWTIYIINSMALYFTPHGGDLSSAEKTVEQAIYQKQEIPFKDHDATSYIYYVYTRNNKR